MMDLSVIEAQLSRVLDFFPRVDARVNGLFAFNTALLIVAVLNLSVGDLARWYVGVPSVAFVISLLISFTFLYRVNFPDMRGGQGSLIYFAEVQNRTETQYIEDFETCSEDLYRRDMLGQIWRNSQILCHKFRAVKMAIIFTLVSMPFFIWLLAATAILHSRLPLLKT